MMLRVRDRGRLIGRESKENESNEGGLFDIMCIKVQLVIFFVSLH